jgi:hypothetical protein
LTGSAGRPWIRERIGSWPRAVLPGRHEERIMGVELSGEADLSRRIDARRFLQKAQVRKTRCKRCRRLIPETRRADALYCSQKCHDDYRREQLTKFRSELRGEVRLLTAPTHCPCGTPLDNRPGKRGKVAKKCLRCRNNENARAYRRRQALDREGRVG